MDSTGRLHSIKIQLLLPTRQALTFCHGSLRAAGNRLESEWCFSVEDESSLMTVPLCCHSSFLPFCLVLVFFLHASLSFLFPYSSYAIMPEDSKNSLNLSENTAEHWRVTHSFTTNIVNMVHLPADGNIGTLLELSNTKSPV